MSGRPLHRWIALAALVAVVACDSSVDPSGKATLRLFASVAGTSVATVVVDVSASDIPNALVFNIPVVDGVAAGSIVVPAGSHRTIAMRAYDADGVETHSGSVDVSIQPGANPTITLTMQPLNGNLPISVSLGSIVVAVTPVSLALTASQTGQLSASITGWDGQPVAGTVAWATSDPGVATVDATGLVTAVRAGSTHVVATFQGAAGQATITVTP